MNSSDTEDFVSMSPKKNTMTRQYLVRNFPTRETFAEAVVNSFTLSGKVTIHHWTCCLEEHENTLGVGLSYMSQVIGT